MRWIAGLEGAIVNLEFVQRIYVHGNELRSIVFAAREEAMTGLFHGTKAECLQFVDRLHLALAREGLGVRVLNDLELLNGPGLVPQEPEDRSGWSGPLEPHYIPALVVTDEPR